jgi:hypothetical protein
VIGLVRARFAWTNVAATRRSPCCPMAFVATSFSARRTKWMSPRRSIHGSLRLACALRHKLPSGEQIGVVSVGVRNLALALACPAFCGVDFPARLHWLHYRSEARSIASWAGMLFDLRRHIELSVLRTCNRHFHNRSRPSRGHSGFSRAVLLLAASASGPNKNGPSSALVGRGAPLARHQPITSSLPSLFDFAHSYSKRPLV